MISEKLEGLERDFEIERDQETGVIWLIRFVHLVEFLECCIRLHTQIRASPQRIGARN